MTAVQTVVAIHETDVCGVKAYHARCVTCGWETRRYDREKTAVKHARAHRCESTRVDYAATTPRSS